MSETIEGAPKGTTPPAEVTATSIDANHTGMDVNVVGGAGSGGGPATIADGADAAQGAKADAAVTNPALSASEIALLKGLLTLLGSALPLPTGAATQTTLAALLSALPGALDGSGGLKVANVAALPAGANLIGSVTANPGAALTLTYTDRSFTITTGGTAQNIMAANSSRKKLFVLNPLAATEDLWIRFTGTAAISGAGSIRLSPGDFWQEEGTGVTTQTVSAIGATTAHAGTAMEG